MRHNAAANALVAAGFDTGAVARAYGIAAGTNVAARVCAVAVAAVLVVIGAACGAPTVEASSTSALSTAAIIGGAACDGRFPTALAIVLDATLDPGSGVEDVTRLMCTGTLIAPDVVLTAAHCTDPKLLTGGRDTVTRADYWVTFEEDLTALAGASTPQVPLPDDAVAVRELVPHEDFDITACCAPGLGDVKDIALLFLAAPIDVQPELVIAPDEAAQLTVGHAVGVAGWGKQTGDAQSPDGTVGQKLCGDTGINELGAAEMQIGDTGTRKCQGDSGGPTYADVETTHAVKSRVIGVTSHQYDTTGCSKGGIDTRVDAYLDWIDAHMSARCDDGSRAWCDVNGIIPASFFDPPPPVKKHVAAASCANAPAPAAALAFLLAFARLRRARRH